MIFRPLLLLCILIPEVIFSQKTSNKKINFGLEQDFLPYVTGGYFAGAWVGKDHLRARTILARVHKPNFITKKGFTNNSVTAYAITADYFLKKNWEGWWIASGLVYWKSSIQADSKRSTAHYNNTLINGSLGYNWKFGKRFYLSPWAGMHLRVAGEKHVLVDGKIFIPPLLNPEASLKIGLVL
jgi:hypothetical protein